MWMTCFAPRLRSAALAGLLFWLLAPTARGDEARLSISGYDPVAYFTDGKPVPGSSEFEYVWHHARWRSTEVSAGKGPDPPGGGCGAAGFLWPVLLVEPVLLVWLVH